MLGTGTAAVSSTDRAQPGNIAVWNSSVDTALFAGQVLMVGGRPALKAYDKYGQLSTSELMSLTP